MFDGLQAEASAAPSTVLAGNPNGHDVGGSCSGGGDLLEHTGTDGQFTDDKGRSPTFEWGMQGSWEGHNMAATGFAFAPMTTYGKTGLRCARD